MSKQWTQGACECHKDVGVCCYTAFCPCLAAKEVADNIGDPNGCLYCLSFFCYCGCCVFTYLGDEVAKKQNIESDIVTSGCKTFFDLCFCYSCTVVKESRVHKEGGPKPVEGQEMTR